MVTAIDGNHHRIVSQANVALPLCLIPTGGGRLRLALGRSGAGINAPENELQNREIGAFFDLVTERGRKLQ